MGLWVNHNAALLSRYSTCYTSLTSSNIRRKLKQWHRVTLFDDNES